MSKKKNFNGISLPTKNYFIFLINTFDIRYLYRVWLWKVDSLFCKNKEKTFFSTVLFFKKIWGVPHMHVRIVRIRVRVQNFDPETGVWSKLYYFDQIHFNLCLFKEVLFKNRLLEALVLPPVSILRYFIASQISPTPATSICACVKNITIQK